MTRSPRIGALARAHRGALAHLLAGTGAFSVEEVEVALSLFDLSVDSAVESAQSPDYEFVGAFDALESLVGYACFGPTPSTDGTYDLYWLAVSPAAQGAGVGRALVGAVERALAGRGARLLVAETSGRPDYATTRAFYAATGYREVARIRDFYAPADDRIMLYRRLTGDPGVATR